MSNAEERRQKKLDKQQQRLISQQEKESKRLQKQQEKLESKIAKLDQERLQLLEQKSEISGALDDSEQVEVAIANKDLEKLPEDTAEHLTKTEWQYFKSHFFDRGDPNRLSGYELFWVLVICSVIGYCIEMVYGYITNGFWESRQSLVYGPFGLAYGLGGIVLTVMLHKDQHRPVWRTFLKSFFWMSVAEYIMSLGEEIVFGAVSWDYSNMPLNINGRVCALYSCFWGILGLVWAKLISPGILKLIDKFPIKPGKWLFIIMALFLFYDCTASAEAMVRYNQRQEGIPATSAIDRLMDKQFPDDYLEKVYANAMKVDDDGKASDETISGRQAKTFNVDTTEADSTAAK